MSETTDIGPVSCPSCWRPYGDRPALAAEVNRLREQVADWRAELEHALEFVIPALMREGIEAAIRRYPEEDTP